MVRLGMILIGCVLLWGCGEGEKNKTEQKLQDEKTQSAETATLPIGTWFLYAGSQTGDRTNDIEKEVTILVLEDSLYSLTLMRPQIHLNFVEKGQVEYDRRNQKMKFSVISSTGVDFSGSEPRKLVDVDQIVPWQRDPGTVYLMDWRRDAQFDDEAQVDREVLIMTAEGHEDSYFVRLQNKDAQMPTLDTKMKDAGQ
jgi:hypothetical protein